MKKEKRAKADSTLSTHTHSLALFVSLSISLASLLGVWGGCPNCAAVAHHPFLSRAPTGYPTVASFPPLLSVCSFSTAVVVSSAFCQLCPPLFSHQGRFSAGLLRVRHINVARTYASCVYVRWRLELRKCLCACTSSPLPLPLLIVFRFNQKKNEQPTREEAHTRVARFGLSPPIHCCRC